eukprot:6201604-Pleurochrysis_carterae.AAC.3
MPISYAESYLPKPGAAAQMCARGNLAASFVERAKQRRASDGERPSVAFEPPCAFFWPAGSSGLQCLLAFRRERTEYIGSIYKVPIDYKYC